jgi:hypothetical protein
VPETGDRQHHQAGVDLEQPLAGQAQAGHYTAAEVLTDDVGPAEQIGERRKALGGLEVEDDRLLVTVRRQEVRRLRLSPVLRRDEGWAPAA